MNPATPTGVAVLIAGVNSALLAVLAAVWLRNYREFGSTLLLGLLGFSAVLLVENLGAWRDLPAPPDWLLVHVPGWDTATAGHLLDRVIGVPIIHFGDLDPNGVRILLSLRRRVPDLKWFLPDFWLRSADSRGLRGGWPPDLDLDFAPRPVREMAARGIWLEQEPIVLDPRTVEALESMTGGRDDGSSR